MSLLFYVREVSLTKVSWLLGRRNTMVIISFFLFFLTSGVDKIRKTTLFLLFKEVVFCYL